MLLGKIVSLAVVALGFVNIVAFDRHFGHYYAIGGWIAFAIFDCTSELLSCTKTVLSNLRGSPF